MRCKIGDRAFVVSSTAPENLGAVVKVIGPADPLPRLGPCWWVQSEGRKLKAFAPDGSSSALVEFARSPDCSLRPIRDAGGEDEMLRLVGRPEGIEA